MPRNTLMRSLLALLPLLGATFAALAGMQGWPALPSLLAMILVACASAIIYWSGPLLQQGASASPPLTDTLSQELSSAAALAATLEPMTAVLPEELPAVAEPLIIRSFVEDPTSGTRAEQLAGERVEQDLLTGLLAPECFFSRFTARLEHCTHQNQTAVLVLCDLDRFGELNQTAGLVGANRLLRAIADSFRLTVREDDLLARLGGDEFALFFPGLAPEIAEARVRHLRAAVRDAAMLTLDDDGQRVTMSVGISCFPRDGETPEVLFEAADVALQAARRQRAAQADRPLPSAVVLTRVEPLAMRTLRTESY